MKNNDINFQKKIRLKSNLATDFFYEIKNASLLFTKPIVALSKFENATIVYRIAYQILQMSVLTIWLFCLQPKALANCGILESGPLTRKRAMECGSFCA